MKRVLVVDDEPELAEIVGEYLRDQYDVEIANSGLAAIAWRRAWAGIRSPAIAISS